MLVGPWYWLGTYIDMPGVSSFETFLFSFLHEKVGKIKASVETQILGMTTGMATRA